MSRSITLPPQAEIEQTAKAFHNAIQSSQCTNSANPQGCIKRFILPYGQTLYQQILAPVSDRIAGKRLLIVGDGALQYTPFAAASTPKFHSSPSMGDTRPQIFPLVTILNVFFLFSMNSPCLQERYANDRLRLAEGLSPEFSSDA